MRMAVLTWVAFSACAARCLFPASAHAQEPVGCTQSATENVLERLESVRDRIGLPRPEEQLQLRLGGYAMLDWAETAQSTGLDPLADDVGGGGEIRDVRIALRGVLYKKLGFKVEVSVDRGTFELKDNYLTLEDVPYVGNVRTGHFKEGFGLENSTSLRHSPFLEHSLMDGITPALGLGLSLANTAFEERATWSLGLFLGTPTVDKIGERESVSLTGRITGLALYDEEEGRLLHLGFSFSHRSLNAPLNYEVRPEVDEAPRYLDTGQFSAGALNVAGIEAAYQHKSSIVQAELTWSATSGAVREEDVTLNDIADEIAERAPRLADWLAGKTGWERPDDSYLWNIPFDLAARGELAFFGGYVQAAHILTGECREYDTRRGVFGPVVPTSPVSLRGGGGWGAWEIAARVSHLDLNDDYVKGGRESNIALGLNWYLTRELRMALNYVHADVSRDEYEGNMNAVVMRMQLDIEPRPVRRPARLGRSDVSGK